MPRWLEFFIALAGVIILSPVLLVLGLLVVLHDRGPAFYKARRIGKDGRPFALLKFRSMLVDADKRGGALTSAADARITPIGEFLRRTKADELPQLLNVLKGDMSFVGPRPEDPKYVALYTPEQREVLAVRPGITSAASLHYRNESALLAGPDPEGIYIREILPHKLAIERDYLRTRSFGKDLGLILRTVRSMVTEEEVQDAGR